MYFNVKRYYNFYLSCCLLFYCNSYSDGVWQSLKLSDFYWISVIAFQGFAIQLSNKLTQCGLEVQVNNMSDYDPEDKLVSDVSNECLLILITIINEFDS